jgi:hypothetical protein
MLLILIWLDTHLNIAVFQMQLMGQKTAWFFDFNKVERINNTGRGIEDDVENNDRENDRDNDNSESIKKMKNLA